MSSHYRLIPALLLGLLAACSGTEPNGGTALTLSLASQSAGGPLASAAAAESVTLGATTIDFTSVHIVLKSIKLVRASHDDCQLDDDVESDDDACEAVKVGPLLFEVPLDPGAQPVLTVDVDAGTYRRLKFHIHKPDGEADEGDDSFLASHPDFNRVSIRIEGTFNGTLFVYETDLNAVQQIAFESPLVVDAAGPVEVTMFLDLASWFQNAQGTEFVDPETALKGGPNENLVEQNIKRSIRVFRDSDQDGSEDGGEGDL